MDRLSACAISLLLGLVLATSSTSVAATVDFDGVPMGTRFGGAYGQSPGDIVLTQDGIDVSVEEFFLGSFTGFVRAEVGGQYAQSFPTPALDLDNISVRFDLSNLGFVATQVTLEYAEFGGSDNFSVNGAPIHTVAALTDLPAIVAPGVNAFVSEDTITLVGVVDSFQIGGQELAIDTIVAVPEPATVGLLGIGAATLMLRRRRRT